jgi:hypothetical protein
MKSYTSDTINEILSTPGDRRVEDILYRRMSGVRKASVRMVLSEEELLEYAKCYHDPIYFFEKYCKIVTREGMQSIKLRPYQKEMIRNHYENRFNIVASSRQTGVSLMLALINTHSLIFKQERGSVIITESGSNMMDMVKTAYILLPFWLKPGVLKWTEEKIQFENGCDLMVVSSIKRALGRNWNSVCIDNYALRDTQQEGGINVLSKIMIPIMASRKESGMTLAFTPNGMDTFYDLFVDAERKPEDPKKNLFVPQRIYWWEVEGRDEVWRKNTTSQLGSSDRFDQEYDLSFRCKR